MTLVVRATLDEHAVPGKPLGRHVEHDPRSREYPAMLGAVPVKLKTIVHRRYGGPFDQGQLGSCTGNATAGCLNTVPLRVVGARVLREADAVAIYSRATHLDEFAGIYPPTDTGSSGLAAAKAAKALGYITSYRHAFGIDEALQALQAGPVITGTTWLADMDDPSAQGFVYPTGAFRGGHEYEVLGYVGGNHPYVVCENSWGKNWGLGGRFKMFVDDWAKLLDDQGDVTVLAR